jgi:hypothetical protein
MCKKKLNALANPEVETIVLQFFKTGLGVLREVGKRDRKVEEEFLLPSYRTMPRTMLHYAIEHFPETRRRAYLKSRI